ncbi:MAG TPA: imelysin family protein [Polyangiaceae bacterium]|nr:imelysin family protein [Polyangiaceae bacterium]
MRRRALLGASVLSALACKRKADRSSVLRALTAEVVAPAIEGVSTASRALELSIQKLAAAPHEGSLGDSRGVFKAALVAWKYAYGLRAGPLVLSNAFLRAMFWPPRPKAIDGVLEGQRAIDEGLLEELGVDAKGIFALESFLFAVDKSDEATVSRLAAERSRRYVTALAVNVRAYADRASRLFGDGRAFADQFASAGQDNVNRLVSQMVDTVEVVAGRVQKIVALDASGLLRPAEVEGWPSQTSREIASALLQGTEALYRGRGGGGMGDLVNAVSKPIDDRVRAAMDEARNCLADLGAPLEQAVKTNRAGIDRVSRSLKALEIAMKSDMASAMGVTLTFTAGDGD